MDRPRVQDSAPSGRPSKVRAASRDVADLFIRAERAFIAEAFGLDPARFVPLTEAEDAAFDEKGGGA